ncbi:replication initiation and membrane attachment family protein [Pallidibacillus thermolactis]|uniref:replication initiation and membrane attachment family protein n=1 Tax=Pallidibacillus thermolactis TaxID=251051 RepID=UPI0021DB5901|nr:DnaD domain protein [Pallidibacillus thermolactis]MCU9601248.1 DnaD domain protein [Pallidibacillus thermolactis subsp. kokeshiiformis]
MEPHWKEIIPGDQYIVSIDGMQNIGDNKVLTLLYQPLIGPVCISLYFTLLNQVEDGKLETEPASHYYLMNLLDLNLSQIYEARQKLEAIGLMETYMKENEDLRSFIYVMKPPLSPKQFFTDGLLNIYLYQKVGRDYYNRLKQTFANKVIDKTGFDKITKGFQDVFSSSHFPYHDQIDEHDLTVKYPTKEIPETIMVQPPHFDFDLFLAGLNESVIPKQAITTEVKDVIIKLAFLYEIDAIQMKNILYSAINEQNQIDIEALRKAARDWYTIEHYSSLPKLVDRTQSPIYYANIDVPKTQEERLIRYLETVSPRQLLIDLSEGSEPLESDLRLIEEIMVKLNLTPGVVNVLIQYCMLRTDMKLTKSFVERIASHWSRKKVKTVTEAMELAKSEHRKYVDWQKQQKEIKSSPRKTTRTTRQEPVPDWLKNGGQTKLVEVDENFDFEAEKKKLEERLKKYKK